MNHQIDRRVASCAPLATQLATFDQNTATSSATVNATVCLKARALAALRRNSPATTAQQAREKHRNSDAQKSGPKLRPNIRENERWLHFVDLAVLHGATEPEVQAVFEDQDIDDLLIEQDDTFPLHAKTLAHAIKRASMSATSALYRCKTS